MLMLTTAIALSTGCAASAQPMPTVVLPRIAAPNSPLASLELIGEVQAARALREAVDLGRVEQSLLDSLSAGGRADLDVSVGAWSLVVPSFSGPGFYGYTVRVEGADVSRRVHCELKGPADDWANAWSNIDDAPVASAQVAYEAMATACASKIVRKIDAS